MKKLQKISVLRTLLEKNFNNRKKISGFLERFLRFQNRKKFSGLLLQPGQLATFWPGLPTFFRGEKCQQTPKIQHFLSFADNWPLFFLISMRNKKILKYMFFFVINRKKLGHLTAKYFWGVFEGLSEVFFRGVFRVFLNVKNGRFLMANQYYILTEILTLFQGLKRGLKS